MGDSRCVFDLSSCTLASSREKEAEIFPRDHHHLILSPVIVVAITSFISESFVKNLFRSPQNSSSLHDIFLVVDYLHEKTIKWNVDVVASWVSCEWKLLWRRVVKKKLLGWVGWWCHNHVNDSCSHSWSFWWWWWRFVWATSFPKSLTSSVNIPRSRHKFFLFIVVAARRQSWIKKISKNICREAR